MATLPDAFDLGQRPNFRAPRKIVSDQSGQIEGEALAQFGENVTQIAGRELEKIDKLNYAQARSAYLQADLAARKVAQDDDDWENSPKKYQEAMTKAQGEALKMVRNNNDRALLQQDLTVDSAQGLAAVRQISDKRRVDVENSGLETLISNNENASLVADPQTSEKLLNEINDALDGAASKGNVTAVWAGQKKRSVAESVAEKQVLLKTPDEQIALLNDPSKGPTRFIPADRRAVLLENAQRDKLAQTKALQTAQANDKVTSIMAIYARDGQQAGTRALSNLSDIPIEFHDEVKSKVFTQLNQRRELAQQQHVDTLAGISRAIATNTADGNIESAVNELYSKGAYTTEQYASTLAAIDRSRIEGAVENAATTEIKQALVSGTPLDPQDPAVKKALIASFKRDTLNMEPGSADWQATASVYAARTRVLPAQAASWARKSMLSPDAKISAPAVQFVASIRDSVPDASLAFDEKTRAFADMASDMMVAGTSPDKAIESARRLVYETNPNLDKQRETEYDNRKTGHLSTTVSALSNLVDRDFDPSVFYSQPAVTPDLQSDFDTQARKYYRLNGGDIDSARESAWRDIKGIYGVSEVNGKRQMMMLPPENFGVKLEQIRADVSAFLATNPQTDGSTAEEIMLVPDSLTQRTAASLLAGGGAMQPSYQLFTKTGDVVTDSNGNRKRYFLPSNEDLAANIRRATEDAKNKAIEQVKRAKEHRVFLEEWEEMRKLNREDY